MSVWPALDTVSTTEHSPAQHCWEALTIRGHGGNHRTPRRTAPAPARAVQGLRLSWDDPHHEEECAL